MARYFRRGLSKVYFETASATPSNAQILAGTDLGAALNALTGWDFQNTPIPTPDLGSTFTSTIGGEDTTQSPSMTFYDDSAGATIRTALAKGNAGWVVRCPLGTGTGKRVEVYPVASTGVNDSWSTGNEAALFVVTFAITAVPNQGYSIP